MSALLDKFLRAGEGRQIRQLEKIAKEVAEAEDKMEAYKKEVSSKLAAIVENAKAKSVAEPHFFRFISEAKKEEFNTLFILRT